MPLTVKCPNSGCGKTYQVAVEHAGRKGRCKSCGTEFQFQGGASSGSDSTGGAVESLAPGGATSPGAATTVGGGGTRTSNSQGPTRLGRFRIQDRVGVGGFGVVYRAQDPQLQRSIALKLLKTTGDDQRDQPRIERFLLEGRAAARLRHPNIVPVFDAGKDEDSGEYYLAAAFIDGKSLAAMVEDGPLEPRTAAAITAQVARALAYAHGQGILHRDVKPDNVMVDAAGTPHLMDFGLARMEDSDTKVTRDGAVMGTASYMSPEQCLGDRDAIGPAADQYSLGCMLHELLTGATPFEGPVMAQIHHHDRTEAPAPSSKKSGIPRDLDTICLRTMAKEPARRYADCAALATDLERWLADEPILARKMSIVERANRWRRRNPAVAGLSLGLVAVLIAGLAGVTSQWLRAEGHARAALLAAEEERTAKNLADQAKTAAESAKAAAEAAEGRAVKDREAAREAALANKRIAYGAHMNLAQQAWGEANIDFLHDLLDRYIPAEGEEDQRGFEWRHWWRVSHGYLRRFDVGGGALTDVEFSPDSQLVATATMDNVIRLWNPVTATKQATMAGHGNQVFGMTFSSDGQQLASASSDGTVRIWDVTSGRETRKRSIEGGSLCALVFLPGGKEIALGGKRLSVWNLETDEVRMVADGLDAYVSISTGNFTGFSPDGSKYAVGGLSRTLNLWDVAKGAKIGTLKGHGDNIAAVAFSPDGKRVATGGWDRVVRVWDVATQQTIQTLTGHTNHVFSVAYSSDGKRIASAGRDLTVRLWDAETGAEQAVLKGHSGRGNSLCFSPDGSRLISGGRDYHATLWDTRSDQGAATRLVRPHRLLATAFTPDGKSIMAGGGRDLIDGNGTKLAFWEVATGKLLKEWDHPGGVKAITLHPDGKRVATLSYDNQARVWDLAQEKELTKFKGRGQTDGGPIGRSLAFSPDGQHLLTHGEKRGTLAVWDLASGQLLRTFDSASQDLNGASYSPDGTLIAAGNIDTIVRVWNAATGELVHKLTGHTERVWSTGFSSDGKILATAGADAHVKLWNVADGSLRADLVGHTDTVTWLSFSPDGRTVASTGGDTTVKVWDSLTGQLKTTLLGHTDYNYCVAFSPDGQTLASGGLDNSIRVWRTADDEQVKADLVRRKSERKGR